VPDFTTWQYYTAQELTVAAALSIVTNNLGPNTAIQGLGSAAAHAAELRRRQRDRSDRQRSLQLTRVRERMQRHEPQIPTWQWQGNTGLGAESLRLNEIGTSDD